MNYSEIEACVIEAKMGNKEALHNLVEQFRPFIFKTAQNYTVKNHDLHDLSQMGYLAVINAVSKYKEGSNTFKSYAYASIKNGFISSLRKVAPSNLDLSLNAPLRAGEENSSEFIDFIQGGQSPEEDLVRTESINSVRKAMSKLSMEELELIGEVYYKNTPIKEYADKENISYLSANRRKQRVLKKLGGYLIN